MTSRRRRGSYSGNVHEGSPFSDKTWVASAEGEAISLFTGGPQTTLHDFVTGVVTHLTPSLNDNDGLQRQMSKTRGVVYTVMELSSYTALSPSRLQGKFRLCHIHRCELLKWNGISNRRLRKTDRLHIPLKSNELIKWNGIHVCLHAVRLPCVQSVPVSFQCLDIICIRLNFLDMTKLFPP